MRILAVRGLLPSTAVTVSVEEVEKDPHAYLHRVLDGETVVVFEKDRPVAEMRPLARRAGKRPIGLAKGDMELCEIAHAGFSKRTISCSTSGSRSRATRQSTASST